MVSFTLRPLWHHETKNVPYSLYTGMGYEALGTPKTPILLPGNELRPYSQYVTSVPQESVQSKMEAQSVSKTVESTPKLPPRTVRTISSNYHYFTSISYTDRPNATLLKCIHCIVRFGHISTQYERCTLWRCSRLIVHSYANPYCDRWYCVQTFVIITATWYLETLVAERCKAWVCGRSLAGTAGSNPTEVMDICLLRQLWDHSSRGVLPSVVYLIVLAEPQE